MGKIFYLMGKSSTGKDTMYNRILENKDLNLKPIVLYTTRPIREGEVDGVQYNFTDDVKFKDFLNKGLIIESRTYQTMHGNWIYFTVDDGKIDLDNYSYIAIGTLESYVEFLKYFGEKKVIPIYIEVEDGERLSRALKRELKPENKKFKEMCRRFLADCDDFSEDKIIEAGIKEENRFENIDKDKTEDSIKKFILANL